MRFLSRFFDTNDREIARLQPLVDKTNELEPEYEQLTDAEIRERIDTIRADVVEAAQPEEPSEEELESPDRERRSDLAKARHERRLKNIQTALDDVIPDVFAAGREAMKRTMGMRQYDVQLMGAIALHQGKIAEMKTGEGKTLIPTLAAVLNGITGRGAHIVTVNDYLARRDAQWMGPAYHFLGLSVGVITHDTSYLFEPGYPTSDERLINLRPVTRREAYAADITYGTNNEFGFDYLRDNMVDSLEMRVQRERAFAIVDEVDNILIDEARTPLIISGQAEESADLYFTFARLVPKLKPRPEGDEEGGDYFVDLKDKAVSATEEGVTKVEQLIGVENLYDADPRLARHFDSALKAHALYKRDRDYIVEDGEIVIVDEFTGRKMPGRRWSEGLHQAIEAKEGLRVQRESRTLATITFQNYFRMYDKLAGMTGTAMTEAEEFHKIYELEVAAIPTHRPMIREDLPDLVYKNETGKFNAVIDEIEEMTKAGRPVLVGTVSVEKSEVLGTLMKRRGIKHEVLNAKQHEREAGVIAQAGRSSAVTIATNMAGRGTDIKLGGDPAGLASELLHRKGLNPAEVDKETFDAALAEARTVTDVDHAKVVEAGGLHIIGTERHDSRRIDNQLRGRSGRQGDPGSSRFYLSLDDDLMKRFASDRVAGLMDRLGLEEDQPIESRLVSKTIESAQTRVEGFNFDIRKRVVEFDDVINKQRETIYAERDKVLRNEDLTETVREFLDTEIDALADTYASSLSPSEWNLEGMAAALRAMGLDGPETAEAALDDAATNREALVEHVRAHVEGRLEARLAEHGEEVWSQVERFVLLRTIDSLWVEHLTEIDDMRRGIGLRGYAQQDPLNEFRHEAYRLYEELSGLIRHEVATTIFRVTVRREPPPEPQPIDLSGVRSAVGGRSMTGGPADSLGAAPGGTNGTGASSGSSAGVASRASAATAQRQPLEPGAAALRRPGLPAGNPTAPMRGLPADPMRGAREVPGDAAASSGSTRQGFTPTGARIGRNDPCWCGSGQKYKKCHGA